MPNMYASAVCSGKVTPGGKKRKKAMGGGIMNDRIGLKSGSKGCKLAMKGKGKAYGKNS